MGKHKATDHPNFDVVLQQAEFGYLSGDYWNYYQMFVVKCKLFGLTMSFGYELSVKFWPWTNSHDWGQI